MFGNAYDEDKQGYGDSIYGTIQPHRSLLEDGLGFPCLMIYKTDMLEWSKYLFFKVNIITIRIMLFYGVYNNLKTVDFIE